MPRTPRSAVAMVRTTTRRATRVARAGAPAQGPAPTSRFAPTPFIGRARELDELVAVSRRAAVVELTGIAGVGKTALVRALLTRRPGASVRCEEHDVAEAIVARAGRALDAAAHTGTADAVLVVDELHRIGAVEAGRVATALALLRHGRGACVFVARDTSLLGTGVVAARLHVDGLEEPDARALWSRLEDVWGVAPKNAFAPALAHSRGAPLALRREFAQARTRNAWQLATLAPDERRVLAALAVLRVPATLAALAVLVGRRAVEPAVLELVRRQLVDAILDGRFEVHDVVRVAALAVVTTEERRVLERRAAAILDDEDPAAVAWEEQDGAALAVPDRLDRLREALRHLCAGGQGERAVERLDAVVETIVSCGQGGEGLAMLARLEAAGVAGAAHDLVRFRLLERLGRVVEARAAFEAAAAVLGARLDRGTLVAGARLLVEAGELDAAEVLLTPVVDGLGAEPRALALAALAELAAWRGEFEQARHRLAAANVAARRATGRPVQIALLAARAAVAGLDGRAPAAVSGGAEAMASAAALAAGRLIEAEQGFAALAADARQRGALLVALGAELGRCRALVARGRAGEAAQRALSLVAAAGERGLGVLVAEGHLVLALAEVAQSRPAAARELLEGVASACAAAAGTRKEAVRVGAMLVSTPLPPGEAVSAAQRSGSVAELALALADAAGAYLKLGAPVEAACAAERALEEGVRSGCDLALARALVLQAALERDAGRAEDALARALDALAVARAAGLGVERFVAAFVCARLARELDEDDGAAALEAARDGAWATLGSEARAFGTSRLAELGLLCERRFRTVDAEGRSRFFETHADAALGAAARSLFLDGKHETIVRVGRVAVALSRRSLLKQLLYFFARAPGVTFDKEQIVTAVWHAPYDPSRHDSALFTSVMRVRRLLGVEGVEWLRAVDGGYRFCPPHDFVFVEKLSG